MVAVSVWIESRLEELERENPVTEPAETQEPRKKHGRTTAS